MARVDGREAFANDDVTTMRLTSLAGEFSFEAEGPVRLEIALPARGLSTSIELGSADGRYVAVSLEAGRLTHYVSETPLGFH